MAVTDPIADYLTRIRNAQMAGHKVVRIPSSNLKKSLTEILYENGFIYRYKFDDKDGPQGTLSIALKYLKEDNAPLIRSMKRVSRPGLRIYKKAVDIPRVIDGLGIAVISTSHGLMTDTEARNRNLGGEVLCYIY
ncbi:30S ribosomal protein S8 [Membranicola marinus]|uniref:Small ribosomal subunit protein uS8 n=1 Tax=Membranihabitans marinus TaxID=1227546 RepID=A0A953HQC9_9BACT|nr:30S ribosomal protein S8 [Membranihabitans marinus]MBY5959314.1 30S ribosomal protein S8 [Membranihabitans marinus]